MAKSKPDPDGRPIRFVWAAWKGGQDSAQVVGTRLEAIRHRGGGVLTPPSVVADARDPRSPLHRYFTWDDTAAAELQREAEARSLIRSIRVVQATPRGEPPRPVLCYLNVQEKDGRRGYVTAARALSETDLRQQVLADAIRYLRGAQKRYGQLKELARVFAALDDVDGEDLSDPRASA